MSRSQLEYLLHIRDEAAYLAAALAEVSRKRLESDETLKRAVARSLAVIGVDYDLVWDAAHVRVPQILPAVEHAIRSEMVRISDDTGDIPSDRTPPGRD